MNSGAYQAISGGKMKKPKNKVAKVMGEFKRGTLHSGSKKGPKVTSPAQAKAIALSEAGKSKRDVAMLKRKKM